MAASDPAMAVATPTGVLQGVAAFSWDGSAWQPSGRAGPAVATPTGVLQGIAPFSWDGSAWQPVGRAQPGVATPTGVLDGVAVYIWSGSAWTPAGGTATPSTPTGALRGVAAFNWDGSAWQPAAQAGPSVATPYGLLQGVAMFNWTGSAWIAAPAASLDLSFMTPGTLDPRITFTRASTGTYFDSAGTMQTAATNAPRWDYNPSTRALNGLLIEEARTNSVRNSAMFGAGVGVPPTNWSMAPSNGLTPSVVGFGTDGGIPYVDVRVTGTASATAVVGIYPEGNATIAAASGQTWTGSWYVKLQAGSFGSPLAAPYILIQEVGLAQTATTLTPVPSGAGLSSQRYNVTRTITNATPFLNMPFGVNYSAGAVVDFTVRIGAPQLEAGAFATSYIPTTAASVTRAADVASMPTAAWFSATASSVAAEAISYGVGSSGFGVIYALSDGTGNNRLQQQIVGGTARAGTILTSGSTNSVVDPETVAVTYGSIYKFGASLTAGTFRSSLNGATPFVSTTGIVMPLGVNALSIGSISGGFPLDGYIRRVRYWPRALTNAELQAVTT